MNDLPPSDANTPCSNWAVAYAGICQGLSKPGARFTADPPHNQRNPMRQTLSYLITLNCPTGADVRHDVKPSKRSIATREGTKCTNHVLSL